MVFLLTSVILSIVLRLLDYALQHQNLNFFAKYTSQRQNSDSLKVYPVYVCSGNKNPVN